MEFHLFAKMPFSERGFEITGCVGIYARGDLVPFARLCVHENSYEQFPIKMTEIGLRSAIDFSSNLNARDLRKPNMEALIVQ
jgi:hypothetical protein